MWRRAIITADLLSYALFENMKIQRAVVVGGGLLGLEAAKAVYDMSGWVDQIMHKSQIWQVFPMSALSTIKPFLSLANLMARLVWCSTRSEPLKCKYSPDACQHTRSLAQLRMVSEKRSSPDSSSKMGPSMKRTNTSLSGELRPSHICPRASPQTMLVSWQEEKAWWRIQFPTPSLFLGQQHPLSPDLWSSVMTWRPNTHRLIVIYKF